MSNFVITAIYLSYTGKDLFMPITVTTARVLVLLLLWTSLGPTSGGKGLGGCIYVELPQNQR